jgi:hypothetical protein
MEYLAGVTLREMIERSSPRALPLAIALPITLDVLRGLVPAHDRVVVLTQRATLLATLRHLGNGWLESAADTAWLHEVIGQLRDEPDWTQLDVCPLCQHDPCQETCPVANLRGAR